MDVGFVGLGAMGHPMAANIVRAGHHVRLWNRSPAKAQALAGDGASLAAKPADAAAAAVVVTMLTDDAAVTSVLDGQDGILAGLPHGGLHVSMSTISYELAQHLAQLHAERGQAYVSAPVFGRPAAADGAGGGEEC